MDLNLNDYIDICETYNITENSYNNYLVESEASDNGSYEEYLAKCKNKGKIPMSKAAYLNKKRKLKIGIGLAAGAVAATGAGIAAKKGLDNSVRYQKWRRERTELNKQAHIIKQQSDAEKRENANQERAAAALDRTNRRRIRKDEKRASKTGFFSGFGAKRARKRLADTATGLTNETIDFFTDICNYYNISENCIEMYNQYDISLNEDKQDDLYQDYVNKCKDKGKRPLSKTGWLDRKDKIKKGLLIGSITVGTGVAAAVGGKAIYNRTEAGKKKIELKQQQQKIQADERKKEKEKREKIKEKQQQQKIQDRRRKENIKIKNKEQERRELYSLINSSNSTGDYGKKPKRSKKRRKK